MISYQLDTNVILRFLTQDKPVLARKVDLLFRKAQKGEIAVEICEPVFIETAVTLRNYYKFPKEKVVHMLETILSIDWIIVENHTLLSQATDMIANSSLDFIDCLIYLRAKAKKQKIFTFDTALSTLASASN
jgi:predicted nucleic-acid-binding protein